MNTETPPATKGGESELVGRYKEKLAQYGKIISAMEAERDEAIKRAEKAEKSYDGDKLRVENETLKQQLRNRTHGDVFRRLAKEAGADERAIDDLYVLSGYKADKDDIDEAKLKTMVEELKAKKPLHFPAPAVEGETPATEPEVRRVPAADRGGSHDKGKSGVRLTEKHLADPMFMLNPKNKDMILAAAKEHRIALPMREAQ